MFERFTDRARRVVVSAQEEARTLNHDHIGTEHILLGLLAEGDGLAAKALESLGISLVAVRDEVTKEVGPGKAAPTGHIPFTPRAKKVLELSLREALALGHNYIGTEHILLGLIREGQGLAAEVLVKQGADLARARQLVIQLLAGVGARGTYSSYAMTPAAARAVDSARGMAGAQPVGSQQVLLGLLADENSLAAQALATLGVSRDQVDAALTDLDPSGSSDEMPEEAGARRTRLQVLGDIVSVHLQEADLAGRLRSLGTRLRSGSTGEDWVLSGTDPAAKGFSRLWKALQPALNDLCRQLEEEPLAEAVIASHGRSGRIAVGRATAGYTVSSRPEGLIGRLDVPEGADPGAVRACIRRFLNASAGADPLSQTEPSFSELVVVVRPGKGDGPGPESRGPENPWTVADVHYGTGPDEPTRRPLSELVAFAMADLEEIASA